MDDRSPHWSINSFILLQQVQNSLVVLSGLEFAFAPDSLESAFLEPADLDDSGGAIGGVALDFYLRAVVLFDEVLEPGGWSTIASCAAVLDIYHF